MRVSRLVLACFTVASLLSFAAALDSGADAGERIQRSFPLQSGGNVVVDHDRGSLTISGWDKNEAAIDVVKHYEGDSSRRDEWLRSTTVEFENSPNRVKVRVRPPNNFCWGWCNYRGWIDVTLHVPRQAMLDLTTDRNTVRIDGIRGSVRVRADRTPVDLKQVSGGIEISTARGGVTLREVQAQDGLKINVDRGNIEVVDTRLPRGAELRADRGNITLRLSPDEKLTLDASRDRRSSFHTDFPVNTRNGFGGSGRVQGEINGGGPTLRLDVDRGSISIERGFARSSRL